MINDLLPRYYEVLEENPKYQVLRSIVIDGHEVAWMRYDGTVTFDLVDKGNIGKPYFGYQLHCECDFTEGVGWKIMNDGKAYGIAGHRDCIYRKMFQHMRHLELRDEYLERFNSVCHGQLCLLESKIPEIIFDLIEKVKGGTFLGEDNEGADYWGGYFYVQTLEKILDLIPGNGFKIAYDLVAQKKIGLNGAVVQEYNMT